MTPNDLALLTCAGYLATLGIVATLGLALLFNR